MINLLSFAWTDLVAMAMASASDLSPSLDVGVDVMAEGPDALESAAISIESRRFCQGVPRSKLLLDCQMILYNKVPEDDVQYADRVQKEKKRGVGFIEC